MMYNVENKKLNAVYENELLHYLWFFRINSQMHIAKMFKMIFFVLSLLCIIHSITINMNLDGQKVHELGRI